MTATRFCRYCVIMTTVTAEGGDARRSSDAVQPSVDAVQAGASANVGVGVGTALFGAGRSAAVVVVSTPTARGLADDLSGPRLVDWLRACGYACSAPRYAEDGGPVGDVLRELLGVGAESGVDGPRIVVTTGGTGLNPADRTPQATEALLDRQTPGIMHALWTAGLQSTPTAVMSQGVAGVAGTAFVVNLPGSTGGVRDGIAVLTPLLPHIQAQLEDCGEAPAL